MASISDLHRGDVVRLTGEAWGYREGHEGPVTSSEAYIPPFNDAPRIDVDIPGASYIDDGDWGWTLVSRADGSPVESDTPEKSLAAAVASGEYHPDMLPLFEKFSQAADDAGHCGEYDRLARSVGAPTRAEVRRLVAERDGQEFDVTFPITVNITRRVNARSEDEAREAATQLDGERYEDSLKSWDGVAQHITALIQEHVAAGRPYRIGEYPSTDQISVRTARG